MRRKRLIAVLLCAEIVLSFAGCSKKKESVSEAKLSKDTQTTVSEESSDQKDPSDTSAKAPSDSTSESTAAPTATPLLRRVSAICDLGCDEGLSGRRECPGLL